MIMMSSSTTGNRRLNALSIDSFSSRITVTVTLRDFQDRHVEAAVFGPNVHFQPLPLPTHHRMPIRVIISVARYLSFSASSEAVE